MRDYDQILGVPPNATFDQIKDRYRFLAQAYHPDKFNSADHQTRGEQEFKLINEAYQILNPEKDEFWSVRPNHCNGSGAFADAAFV